MRVEDNSFDFLVRDRLRKECNDRNFSLTGDPHRDQIMLDMITYCARGNREEAVLNLNTTKEFINGFNLVCRRLPSQGINWWWWQDPNGWQFMFEFWKKCFIQIKVAVQKEEPIPSESYHVVISREYGRFLQENNFDNIETMKTDANSAVISLKNASEYFNNIFKDMQKEVP